MKRMLAAVLVLGALTVGPVLAARQAPPPGGQGRGGAQAPAPPMTNLQIIPKDTPRPQVIMVMQGFTQALGVTCAYCHIFEGVGNPANDFASDMKPPKAVGRVMMRMTAGINMQLAGAIAKPDLTKVNCGTCHRGEAIPTAFVPPPAAGQGGGAPPAGRQ
jgi:hypothetical protein